MFINDTSHSDPELGVYRCYSANIKRWTKRTERIIVGQEDHIALGLAQIWICLVKEKDRVDKLFRHLIN